MRKVICLLTVVLLCVSLAMPAFATEGDFVPSITYKPEPEIVPVEDENGVEHIGTIVDENGEIISYVDDGCLKITPIANVWSEEEEVLPEVKELLLFVYDELFQGEMELPYNKFEGNVDTGDMVIRDLFDARWHCAECEAAVEPDGVTFDLTFDLGVMADVEIYVMTYDEETKEWEPIVKTVNNGDGTVTCTFEHLCAITFSMNVEKNEPATDDAQPANILPWIILLVVAVVAVVVVLFIKKKKTTV